MFHQEWNLNKRFLFPYKILKNILILQPNQIVNHLNGLLLLPKKGAVVLITEIIFVAKHFKQESKTHLQFPVCARIYSSTFFAIAKVQLVGLHFQESQRIFTELTAQSSKLFQKTDSFVIGLKKRKNKVRFKDCQREFVGSVTESARKDGKNF